MNNQNSNRKAAPGRRIRIRTVVTDIRSRSNGIGYLVAAETARDITLDNEARSPGMRRLLTLRKRPDGRLEDADGYLYEVVMPGGEARGLAMRE